jgi:transcriptional regulator with XRE-family HTH domain
VSTPRHETIRVSEILMTAPADDARAAEGLASVPAGVTTPSPVTKDPRNPRLDLSEFMRRYRTVRGIKQAHLAELLRVSQSTVSKWENGSLPSEDQYFHILGLLGANPSTIADTWLARLVETSREPIHAVCDITHRLLVASPTRYQEWCSDRIEMFHRPLLHDAPLDIIEAEQRLLQQSLPSLDRPMLIKTAGQVYGRYRVNAGFLLWERLQLTDGTWVRLVTTVDPDRIPKCAITV